VAYSPGQAEHNQVVTIRHPVVTSSCLVTSLCPLDLTGTCSVGDMASFLVVDNQCGQSMGDVGS